MSGCFRSRKVKRAWIINSEKNKKHLMLNKEVKTYIDNSVLCWLATSNLEGEPNVSPKEVFTYYEDEYIIVANIASPNTVKNIKLNNKVCISFIEVFVQKGFQIKGTAEIISKKHSEFNDLTPGLLSITKGQYPFASITKIKIENIKPIVAPSYIMFPDIPETIRIENAKRAYNDI